MNNGLHYPMSRLVRDLTVTVHIDGVKVWRTRLWLGTQVLKFAAFVMGCKVRMEVGQ